ncbi:MAG: 4Fe-4S dicluster domain-containing protein [SAR202 cluster bacterium]|nr:4Fe-4S dicluster domain-containing protein [SAR202 cluster bacterium]
MLGNLKGLLVTLGVVRRKHVTAQYPDPKKRLQVDKRFMGFPALLWDYSNDEPFCTGCMVCVRACPTQCMSAQMQDNLRHADGTSRRRKIIETFEINLNRCIVCAICVDVCNFDAIEMSHEHEMSRFERNGARSNLQQLLNMGKKFQSETGWEPIQPEKNLGSAEAVAKLKAAGGQASEEKAPEPAGAKKSGQTGADS